MKETIDISALRREFSLKTLDENNMDTDPLAQFKKWISEAMQVDLLEANAMTLSTVRPDGRPSSRVVLLKQLNPDGFVFYTNYESNKAIQLDLNPHCALNFVWHELERQVRIEGICERISDAESDAYFESRPRSSQLGAWASPQSKVILSRQEIERKLGAVTFRFEDRDVIRPQNWGGYLVKPNLIEFWQGRSSRLHDRIQYRLEDQKWIMERLAP